MRGEHSREPNRQRRPGVAKLRRRRAFRADFQSPRPTTLLFLYIVAPAQGNCLFSFAQLEAVLREPRAIASRTRDKPWNEMHPAVAHNGFGSESSTHPIAINELFQRSREGTG